MNHIDAIGELLHARLQIQRNRRHLAESRVCHLKRLVGIACIELRVDLVARDDVACEAPSPGLRHLQFSDGGVVGKHDLGCALTAQRISEHELVLRDKPGARVDIQRDLLRVGHHERHHAVFTAVELIVTEVAQRVGSVQRLSQYQMGKPAVVLDELLLRCLLGGNRRHRTRAMIVRAAFTRFDHYRVVTIEARAADSLLERQPVVLQIQHQRFLELTGFKGRPWRWHLQARPGFALQLQLQRFDSLQCFAATDRRDRRVDDLARLGSASARPASPDLLLPKRVTCTATEQTGVFA